MIRSHWLTGCLLACAVQAVHAAEPQPVGMVKTSKGLVSIERSGQRQAAPVGAAVFAGDRLRTGEASTVGVTLKDSTLLSTGPNSLLVIDKFEFDQTTHEGALGASLRKGTLAVVSGKLAKQAPESVEFRTPSAILGVRGTEFAVEVANDGEE